MGDMVLLTVLLRILSQRYGQPCDILTSGSWSRALLDGHPDVGAITVLGSRTRPYWSDPAQWAVVRALRARRRGAVYVCDHIKQDKLLWWLDRAGVEPRRRAVYSGQGAPPEPWVERWQRFGQRTPDAFSGLPPATDIPDHPLLHVSEDARRDLDAFLDQRRLQGRLWLLQPGSKRTLKRGRLAALDDDKWWPVERWARIARHLLAADRADQVLLCGAPSEQPLLRQIASQSSDERVHALGDCLPLPRLLALCQRSIALTSIDTGPAHAAVALGCPSVVLFGAAEPGLWRPRGPAGTEVIALRADAPQPSVSSLGFAEVWQACQRLRPRVR